MSKMEIYIIVAVILVIVWIFLYTKFWTNNSENKIWWTVLSSSIELSDLQKRVKEAKKEEWFGMKNCNELIVQYYKKAIDRTPTKEFVVTDKKIITEITNNLNTLPKNWDMFIEFTWGVKYIRLTFFCENNKNYSASFYWSRLQSPKTSFYMNQKEWEKNVLDIVDKLISEN